MSIRVEERKRYHFCIKRSRRVLLREHITCRERGVPGLIGRQWVLRGTEHTKINLEMEFGHVCENDLEGQKSRAPDHSNQYVFRFFRVQVGTWDAEYPWVSCEFEFNGPVIKETNICALTFTMLNCKKTALSFLYLRYSFNRYLLKKCDGQW